MQSERNRYVGQWSVASESVDERESRAFALVSDLQPPASRHQPLAASSRRAFTLTELLVVIAIIAVLAAMVSVGVMRALDTAKQTRIKTEVDQLDAAFKAYQGKVRVVSAERLELTCRQQCR